MMNIRSLTFQVVALVAIPAFAAYHKDTPYNFTFSSFAREGEITLPTEGEAKGTYELGEETEPKIETSSGTTTIQTPVFDRAIDVTTLVGEGDNQLTGTETVRPIAYIPQDITLTSISIVTPGDTAPLNLILTNNGTRHTLTLAPAETPETITLYGKDANGTVGTRSGVVHTYNVASGKSVTLNPGTDFKVAFESNDQPGQAQNRTVYCVDGRPYLRIVGHAMLEHHIFKINDPEHTESHSLATLLANEATEAGAVAFVDDPNTVIVVEFEENGGGVSLDKEVLKSPIVFGSSVTPDKAHVHFPGTVKLESALTFRDGAAQGGVSIYGPTDTANYEAARWNPSAMLLRCDLTLRTALPPLENGWFLTHSTTIPAGRTFRLELDQPVGSEDNLPNLSFADATSRLELASSIGGQTLAPKYLDLMTTQSGTLVLDRDVTYSSNLMLRAKAPGLNTTIIQKSGTFSCRNFYVLPSEDDANTFESFTFLQEGGTFEVTGQSFTIEATQKRIQVGPTEGDGTATMTLASSPTLFEEGSTTVIDVNKGGTLTLTEGLAAGAAGTTATLDLTVAGTLKLDANLEMTPASRRTLTLAGGIIESTRYYPEEIHVTCADGGTSDGEGLLDIVDGGTLTGTLVVDAAAGQGDLALGADTTLEDLRDYTGTVSGEGRLEAITGSLGDVTLGDTWLTDAAGKRLGDVLTGWTEDGTRYSGAADFAGTIGFTAGTADDQKKLDFTNLDELTSLGMAFRINNYQHIIMRLDQYADAVIRWPDKPQDITLTLIESGAYGGELTLPHFPHTEGEKTGVTFEFATFNAEGGYTVREDGYSHTHTEDGVNDTLTWDNPVFTGEGAWIDVEFDGTSANTGWFNLGEQNGCLVGVEGPDYGAVTANDSFFVAMGHPVSEGMTLGYRPYVAESALPSFPEEWSLAVRMTAPSSANKCILAIGNNYANATASTYSLVFATGAVEEDGTTEVVLWKFDGYADGAAQPAQDLPEEAIHPLFRVKVADAQSAPHVFSVVCDGETLNLYMDGAWLKAVDVPDQTLSGGLQLGQQLGGSRVSASALERADNVTVDDGGAVDYIRFYKGAFPDAAMVEMADRTPYVRENLRYVRYVPISTAPDGFTKTVPTGGETWIQDGAWQAETFVDGAWVAGDYFDQPAEGAECRLLVAPGEYTIQVNVERQVTGEQDGDGQTVPKEHYFYSPDRNYAALVLAPQSGQTKAGTLRLTPLGVTAKEADDTGVADENQAWAQQVISGAWFTETATSTAANRTGFRYGTLRFTGGASDPINDAGTIPNFYGAGYLLSGSGTTNVVPTTEESAKVYTPAKLVWADENIKYTFETDRGSQSAVASGTATQTATQTYTYTVTTTTPAGYTVAPINGIYDAGVCYLSKHALVVLKAAVGGGSTRVERRTGTRTWRRTADATRNVDWQVFWYVPADPPENRVSGTWGTAISSDTDPEDETSEVVSEGASQLNTLTMVAGRSLTRGETAEVREWQLTGRVLVEPTAAADADPVAGHPALREQDADNDQASFDVWVPFFLGTDAWKFYDDTRTTAHGGDTNADGAANGLFARGVQTPGRLYLDFTATNGPATYQTTQAFSEQAWYRYGYEGEAATETVSGMAPIPATAEDFDQAVAFQIRLDEAFEDAAGIVSLVLDKNPKAKVQVFYVEESAASNRALTLTLTTGKDATGKDVEPLVIHKNVVAAARLDVSNDKRVNALSLRPEPGLRTPVHRGNATHGHGAYIVGTTLVDWDFGATSSVPSLEVVPGAELSFTVGQDFRTHGTTVVAQGKGERTFPKETGDAGPTADDLKTAAWIHHMSDEPFLGQDVELGEGAIFGFHAEAASSNADVQNEGVVLAGELRLTGNATLRADYNNPDVEDPELRIPHFIAAGGIRATGPGITLIVDAPTHQGGQGGAVDWHCHTANLKGEEDFRLWKTGPGTVTFYASEPPSVTGKVTVEEGTLAVTAAADTLIGAKGLHVKKGATLADSGRMTGEARRLAIVPDGQTLSGGGTVKGILRLESGAIYEAKRDEALTADGISVDGSLEANINVTLPEDYKAGTPYLKANREERNVRGRLLSLFGETRWDSIAWIDKAASTTTAPSTSYAARPPQVPAPTDYAEGVPPGTIEGIIKEPLINQYQNAGHAYIGATSGRTRAGTYALNPDELSDALLCFTNISAFVDASAIREGREYVDGTNFYVGYEFGISRQALVTIEGTEYVVLEVSVESVFDDGVSFPNVGFNDVQRNFEADFSSATKLSFDLIDAAGTAHPLGEDGLKIPVKEVSGMDGTPVTPGKRWFRIALEDLLNTEYVKEDGNIRLRASATSRYAQPTSTR